MPKKLTKTDVLLRLDQINTQCDQKVYLYPKSQAYTNQSTKMQFRCEHGHKWLTTTSNIFARSSKCPQCKQDNEIKNKRTPWNDVLTQFNLIHNNKFTYD